MDVVNLEERLSRFDETWSPRIVGRLNGQLVKVARLAGEFVWHHHAEEDELFLVIAGRLRMKFRDGERLIAPGEFIIVPRGVEHRILELRLEARQELALAKFGIRHALARRRIAFHV